MDYSKMMDYIFIYEFEGRYVKDTKAVITKKTSDAYYYMVEGVEERVLKSQIGKMLPLPPNSTKLYLTFDYLIRDINWESTHTKLK